jgi:hypothetical protein
MNKRRAVLTLWVVIVTFFLPSASHAYIDPATTTYIIQVFAAVVITLGVSLSVFIYKFRMIFVSLKTRFYQFLAKVSRSRRIKDKIAGQARSDADGEIPPKPGYGKAEIIWGSPEIMGSAEGGVTVISENIPAKGRLKYLLKDDRKFKTRLLMSLLLSCAVSFTFIVFGIFELTIKNAASLSFSLNEISKGTLLIGFITAVVLTIVLSVFKGRIYDILISFVLALLIGGYLQGNFLNVGIGELNGDGVVWDKLYKEVIINLVIWLFIILLIFALRYFSKKTWRVIAMAIPALLILIQGIALISIYPVNPGSSGKDVTSGIEKVVTYDGLTELSKKNNVVVFILDRLDQRYLEDYIKDDPNALNPLDGFTMYTQNVGSYEQTFPSIAFMMSGKYYYADIPSDEYTREAYQNSDLFDDMHKAGMRVNLYATMGTDFLNIEDLEGIADNITPIKVTYNKKDALKKLLRLSAYRYAPHAMKASFYISTEDFDGVKHAEVGEQQPYISDDPKFYSIIKKDRLHISNENSGTFQFYHLNGPHVPYTMNANAEYDDSGKVTRLDQTKGSFRIVYEYIDQLKALGLYENTTIIITADHGYSSTEDGHNLDPRAHLTSPELSALLVKPTGSSNTPLKLNDAAVAQLDFRASIMKAAGLDYAKYGTPYDESTTERSTPRIHFHRSINADRSHEYWERNLEQWDIIGDARNFDNWKVTDNFSVEYWYNIE